MKISIDAAAGGAFMDKPINEAKQLFTGMALTTIIGEVSEANERREEGMKLMPLLCLLARWMLFFKR